MPKFGTMLIDAKVIKVTAQYIKKCYALSITSVEEFVGIAIATPKDFAAYLEISEEDLAALVKQLEPYIESGLLEEFRKPLLEHPLGANPPLGYDPFEQKINRL